MLLRHCVSSTTTPAIRRFLRASLRAEGYDVIEQETGDGAPRISNVEATLAPASFTHVSMKAITPRLEGGEPVDRLLVTASASSLQAGVNPSAQLTSELS